VLAVLDVFEALTSDRPYRTALPIPEALELIRRDAGTHFDPRVTKLFETLLERGEIAQGDVPKIHVSGLLTASRLQSAS
jgi:HD-GYP domain-containing protein (c-di-GMP phosphodiesterase class II)